MKCFEIPTHSNKQYGTVIGEREVVVKERKAGAYRLSAYYIAKMVSELPMLIIVPIVQLSVMYWMAGLGGPIAFAMFIGINLLNCFTNQVSQDLFHLLSFCMLYWLMCLDTVMEETLFNKKPLPAYQKSISDNMLSWKFGWEFCFLSTKHKYT